LQMFEIVPLGSALQGFEPLGGDPKGVRHRHPDSAGAHVETKNPADRELVGRTVLGTAGPSLA
jgi:hypothetical protein